MRLAAVGDSFTEGVGDERPDGSVRGWADRLAHGLAEATGNPVEYANFAVRGRKLADIVNEQLDQALSLDPRPTHLTFNGGGNDMLRPGMDAPTLVGMIRGAVERVVTSGVHLILIAGPDPTERLPFGSSIKARGDALTQSLRDVGDHFPITTVNIWGDPEIRKAGYWSPDRLHLNGHGHARAASIVMDRLGYDGTVIRPDPATVEHALHQSELQFYRQHLTPWVLRRLRGESSGDGRVGKHLEWVTITPGATA